VLRIQCGLTARNNVEVVLAAAAKARLQEITRNLWAIGAFCVHRHSAGERVMSLLLIIIVLVLLFGGGGGYYAHRNYGGTGLGGVLGLVVIVILVIWLVNRTSVGI
jgi:hypothetical protein